MDLEQALTTADPTLGRRNAPQFWTPYAWAVRVLVDRGYGKSTACRRILARGKIPDTKENLECLRVRYYAIRKKPWPQSMESLRVNPKDPVEGRRPPKEEPPAVPQSMEAEWGDAEEPEVDAESPPSIGNEWDEGEPEEEEFEV